MPVVQFEIPLHIDEHGGPSVAEKGRSPSSEGSGSEPGECAREGDAQDLGIDGFGENRGEAKEGAGFSVDHAYEELADSIGRITAPCAAHAAPFGELHRPARYDDNHAQMTDG